MSWTPGCASSSSSKIRSSGSISDRFAISVLERQRADRDDRLARGIRAAEHREHARTRCGRVEARQLVVTAGNLRRADRRAHATIVLDDELDGAGTEALARDDD